MIDYQELLKKYINHVGEEEGFTFLSYNYGKFTDEEWSALQELDVPETTVVEPLARSEAWATGVKKILLEELRPIRVN